MTFEPTLTIIEAVTCAIEAHVRVSGGVTFEGDAEAAIKALIAHLQNNPDDARMFKAALGCSGVHMVKVVETDEESW